MSDHGKAWPLAEADLTNQVCLTVESVGFARWRGSDKFVRFVRYVE